MAMTKYYIVWIDGLSERNGEKVRRLVALPTLVWITPHA
jgi:hypothetical protein